MSNSTATVFFLFFFLTSSSQEKELLKKQQEEIEEAERAKRNKVVVTFDLVGRKVCFFTIWFDLKDASWICCCNVNYPEQDGKQSCLSCYLHEFFKY